MILSAGCALFGPAPPLAPLIAGAARARATGLLEEPRTWALGFARGRAGLRVLLERVVAMI